MINKRYFILHFNLECYFKFTIRKKYLNINLEVQLLSVCPLLCASHCASAPPPLRGSPSLRPPTVLPWSPPLPTHPLGQNTTAGAPHLDPDLTASCPLSLTVHTQFWPRGKPISFVSGPGGGLSHTLVTEAPTSPSALSLQQESQHESSSTQGQDFKSQRSDHIQRMGAKMGTHRDPA